MKDIVCVSVFVVLLVVSSGHRNETNQGNLDKDTSSALRTPNENRTPQTDYTKKYSTKEYEGPPHRHRHHRGENALENVEEKSQKELRCARYTKNLSKRMAYYGMNMREYDYTPTRCYQQYCSCPVSTCRRRCPYQRPTSIYEGKDWYGPKHGCRCNPRGSEIPSCDIITGQCRCKTNYIGLQCDSCQPGYWEHPSLGCIRCDCDAVGSASDICDNDGNCSCKSGVGGARCDRCLSEFYGFGSGGCQPCEACNKLGHICDQSTGACVCPPLKEGPYCQNCVKDAWLRLPDNSCIACECSQTGSIKSQCNPTTGHCTCKQGFEGKKCDKCSYGYYGFPKCRRCNCNPIGTQQDYCDHNNICQCDEHGNCPCKSNVEGKRCSTCKKGTFGLDAENFEGCTKCFCFGRSDECVEAGYTWEQIRANDRTVTLQIENNLHQGLTSNEVNNLNEIPFTYGDVKVVPSTESALYWPLPESFNGDLVKSYGGYVRFTTKTIGPKSNSASFSLDPLIVIYGKEDSIHSYGGNNNEVKLVESYWKRKNKNINREELMIILQNVTKILIKASDFILFDNATLSEVSLDVATDISGKPPPRALSVEKCECPKEYEGTSCQNPNTGYFRYFPDSPFTAIDRIIGKAQPCDCNGLSNYCDRETGHCLNCSDNRAGYHCEECAEGFYADKYNKCRPCLCPNEKKNFASSCVVQHDGNFHCFCKKGYSAPKCTVCENRYYGNPLADNGTCTPCDCHPAGSYGPTCNIASGQCDCKPGFKGKQCSQCDKARHVIQNNMCAPCDHCTQILLDDLDMLFYDLDKNTIHLQGGIKPPWSKLDGYQNQYTNLNNEYNFYKTNKTKARELLQEANKVKQKLPKLKNTVVAKQREIAGIDEEAEDLAEQSNKARDKIETLKNSLKDILDSLNKLGVSHESTKSAIKKAKAVLKELHKIQSHFKLRREYEDILNSCNGTIERAQELDEMLSNTNVDNVNSRLLELQQRLTDLETIVTATDMDMSKAEELNAENKARIANLTNIMDKIKLREKIDNITLDVEEVQKYKKQILDILNKTAKNYKILENSDEYKRLMKQLQYRENQLRGNISIIMEYLNRVNVHVNELNKNVTDYKKILDVVDGKWKSSIDAYVQLKQEIDDAKKAAQYAKNELEQTYNIIRPIGGDSINDKASVAYADSTRTLRRIQNNQELPDTRNASITLATTTLDLQANGKMNNDQTSKIRQMANNNRIIDLYKVINDAIATSENMQRVYQNVTSLNYTKTHDLFRDYEKYLNLTSLDNIKKLEQKIYFTREKLRYIFIQNDTAIDNIKRFNHRMGSNNSRIKSIEDKLNSLKARIQRARETSEGIKVSLRGESCSMKYAINNLEPSIFSSLKIRINDVKLVNKSYSLFYIENPIRNQYMNLTLEPSPKNEKKIRVHFEWKLGMKAHSIYINFEDTLNEILMTRNAQQVNLTINNRKWKAEKDEHGTLIFYTTRTTFIDIGKDSGLPGCLRDIIWNGHRIGFWNFYKKEGTCSGCVRAYEDKKLNFFGGNGYAKINNPGKEDKRRINLGFSITTLDENALLYVLPQPKNLTNSASCMSFMAISLKNGHVQAELYDDHGNNIIIQTDEKLNTGTPQSINVKKYYERKTNIVTFVLNSKSDNKTGFSLIDINNIPSFYFGGVPPEYHFDSEVSSCLPQHTRKGFLGTIDNIVRTDSSTISLTQDSTFYDLSLSQDELKLTSAWFSGNGYIVMKPINISTMGFMIRTNQSDAFVMSVEGLGKISLKNGKLHIKFKSEHEVTSGTNINDDGYYYVQLANNQRLKINDEEQDEVLHYNSVYNAQITLGLHPNESGAGFIGGLRDIVINNETLYFSNRTISYFTKTEIGRSWSLSSQKGSIPEDISEHRKKDGMQSTEGCYKIGLQIDPNAVKFGDNLSEPSYTIRLLKNGFWKNNFSIEFDFRTFYPGGTLFLARHLNARKKKFFFILLEIRNGTLQMKTKGHGKKSIISEQRVDDGEWHHVFIMSEKKKRSLAVTLDASRAQYLKINKIKAFRELYFGGHPRSSSDMQQYIEQLNISQFRGCIGNLKMNNHSHSLIYKEDKKSATLLPLVSKVGLCYSNVEKGAYFGGDAYAIWTNEYKVDRNLELSFEFKTTQLNGILVSISNSENSPALSIELQNGAVVMTLDSGSGYISNVTNQLSEAALCNKEWNKLFAFYSTAELTVNVNGIIKSWVVPNEVEMKIINAPLYIGGIPNGEAVGTLKVRENFKGCLRNVKVEEERKDWTDMYALENVLLNSCPRVS